MGCPCAVVLTPAAVATFALALFISHYELDPANPILCGSALAIMTPHLLYLYIWNNAPQFQRVFRTHSIRVFTTIALLLKIGQMAAYSVWYRSIPKQEQIALATGLLLVGQVLNYFVMKKLGYVGVYYGFKFGYKVEWVTSFPFNVLRHPQYVGGILSFAGVATLVYHPSVQRELFVLFTIHVASYITTGLMEASGDQKPVKADTKDEESEEVSPSSSPSATKKKSDGATKSGSKSRLKRSTTPKVR